VAAAAPPPDDPEVQITILVTDDESEALERLATERHVTPDVALREALGIALFVHGLLAEGCTVLYRRSDGATGEIQF
jgi:hypothetical protein